MPCSEDFVFRELTVVLNRIDNIYIYITLRLAFSSDIRGIMFIVLDVQLELEEEDWL